jgi:hypothetical protein
LFILVPEYKDLVPDGLEEGHNPQSASDGSWNFVQVHMLMNGPLMGDKTAEEGVPADEVLFVDKLMGYGRESCGGKEGAGEPAFQAFSEDLEQSETSKISFAVTSDRSE